MTIARDIEECAAHWLMRREEPDWSESEQAELDAWLEASVAHKAAYWRLEHGWRQADRIAALGDLAAPSTAGSRPVWLSSWRPFAIAASLVAFLTLGVMQVMQPEPVEVAPASFDTPVGGRKIVSLADGSRIELNTATLVRAAVTEERREVWLDRGEAYFDVARSRIRPFVVHAGPRTITVLGTKFSVRREDDTVTVAVVEGRVRIDDAKAVRPARSATITGGDVAIIQGASTLVAADSAERVASGLSWRDGMLAFDQSTLAEAAAEFNRYNRRKMVVTDPQAAEIRIGGTFEASNVDAFVRLLQEAYGLRAELQGDEVKISS